MNGLVAATMARAGFRGAHEAIEGKSGFLRGYAPAAQPERAVAGIGETWETLGIAIKPYPSCRYSHAAMDALIELRAEHTIDWHDVVAVEIGLPRTGWNIIGDPEEEKQRPKNYVDGQFSMPFCAAVVLRDGGMDWDSYARHLGDEQTLALCQRIKTIVDDQVEADFPRYMAGVARVRTKQGNHEKYVAIAKGEPENFLSIDELRTKFDGLVGPYLDTARRDEIWQALLALEKAPEVSTILRLTLPAGEVPSQTATGEV
jgi:2-methylcitrate dehydratase PrpD